MPERELILSFITSLRHPETTDNYVGVEKLLGNTLRSLEVQTNRDFEVVVVANSRFRPPAGLNYPVTCLVVDFPRPPTGFASKDELHASVKLDKGLKLAVGLSRSRGAHAMSLDSDDFVSRRIVDHVGRYAGQTDGWYVDRGIRYDVGTGLFRPQRRFNDVCGTSLIWRRALIPAPDLGPAPTSDAVIAAYGRDRVLEELGSHRVLRRRYSLVALPFSAAAYTVNHGQNHSGSASPALGVPLGRRRAAEFGITPRPTTEVWGAASAQLRPANLRRGVAAAAGALNGR